MNIYVTGASGFVGKNLIDLLINKNHVAFALDRNTVSGIMTSKDRKVDCIVHLAGRAHVMDDKAKDIYEAYRNINVDFTLKVAKFAYAQGIQRFIFLSSIKVNGEASTHPFNELNSPAPTDAYGLTKLEAESLLQEFCRRHQMELVIIRSPLIYGPDVKANFKSLIQLCKLPIPLPFGAIHNKRSLISLENLNSFIELCCHNPDAANQTFLISDDHDVSTSELIRTIKVALGSKPVFFPMPQKSLDLLFKLSGKKNLSERLLGNLQLDITKAKQLLNWSPMISFEEGIQRTVKRYVN